jgi:sucrose-6-phosphate hydrolase SacC (GH32 family)
MYDCYNVVDCLPPNTTSPGLGDNPFVGIARPADMADANLTKWNKDPKNPVYIQDANHVQISRGFAGPSNLFTIGDTINMVMQLGNDIARFESADSTLHNWTVADPKWFSSGGRSGHGSTGIMFFALPGAGAEAGEASTEEAGTEAGAEAEEAEEAGAGAVSLVSPQNKGTLTHMLSGIWPNNNPNYLVGCPWVVMGHYDSASGNFTNTTAAQPLDAGQLVIWSTAHVEEDTGRMLYLGWFNYGAGCLTAPREIFYDPRLQKLRALPVKELASLRQDVLGTHQSASATATKPLALFDDTKTSLSFDIEADVTLPSTAVTFGVAIMASSSADAEVFLKVVVGESTGTANGLRTVNISTGVPGATPKAPYSYLNATFSFQLPEADTIALRVLADRTTVEVFVGSGRGVITTGVLSPGMQDLTHNKAFIFTEEASLEIKSATAWAMGCGWARYP